ncbi:MAG: YncE family protein [Candidatus Korobacteraceae bacterium]
MTRRALLFLLACSVALTALPATPQTLLTTITTGLQPAALAINPATGKLYVANQNSNNVTVIDEATDSTTTISVGTYPTAIAVNSVTNKIYAANQGSNNVTVIDGIRNSTIAVAAGRCPQALAVNSVTNQIFVANYLDNNVTAINGSNNLTFTIPVGDYPSAVAVNSSTNKVYVTNLNSNTVTVINGMTGSTTTVPVGSYPRALALNPLTNKIYVANGTYDSSHGTVTVIDGSTNSTTAVPAGQYPNAVAVDLATNKIYVANAGDGTVTVIDGATNSTATISVGSSPGLVTVDPVTNKIYVTNDLWYGTVTMIDGVAGSTTTIAVGRSPYALVADPVSNRIYAANLMSNTVSVIAGAWSDALQFVPATPCRLVDTRKPNGPFGGPAISGGTSRDFTLPGNPSCGVPATAAAYSLNVAVVPHGTLGYVTVWPTGEDQPVVSTLNSLDGRIKANAAIVPAGMTGAVRVYASNTTDIVLDIDGYFLPAPDPSAYAYFPLTPCRVADTRTTNGPLGGPYLYGSQQRDFPVLAATSCNIPNSAVAYSLNFAAIPRNGAPLGYLTVWPTGLSQPVVSTLNALTGTVTANAAIVPAGQSGKISVYPSQDTDLVIDINGYFAPPAPGGLSLYSTAPCRVLDTRKTSGAFEGGLIVNVVGGPCGVPTTAQAYVLNAAVVPLGSLGYLTLWPSGQSRPLASTLNALDGAITSNMAIVPTTNGYIDAYASGLTQLVLDISSYFAP